MKTFHVTLTNHYANVRLSFRARNINRVWPKVERAMAELGDDFLIAGWKEAE